MVGGDGAELSEEVVDLVTIVVDKVVLVGASRQEQKVLTIAPASEMRTESKDAFASRDFVLEVVLLDFVLDLVAVLVVVAFVVVLIVELDLDVVEAGAFRLWYNLDEQKL
ncbi:hypothetical protein LTR78_003555 [Recurvomyces mirabilis]|uniref:Uncharacterized protein n=1 Tax=Recurvomyces mirabilis TaxID=574656 RepID=A0AAE0WRQ1_9PEZI|nr:hypothetical protein LTR78_003555 [Recurvomyces mirabilis]KAK5154413.1 hypothetical protein LTS14_006548 [Recurvomyces mirabilis]